MEQTVGLPRTVLADAGYASREAVAELEAKNIEPLVAIARTQAGAAHRRAVAPGDAGQAANRRGQSPLQET